MRFSLAAMLLSIAGCAAAHAPDSGAVVDAARDAATDFGIACGHFCEPCCPGDICNGIVDPQCGTFGCAGGVACDTSPPSDAWRPPSEDTGAHCGGPCEACCDGGVCFGSTSVCEWVGVSICLTNPPCDANYLRDL